MPNSAHWDQGGARPGRRPDDGRQRAPEHGRDGVKADTEVDLPLFATPTGRPIDQPYVFRLLQRVAKAAGIAQADRLSPHSLQHSVATLLLDRGHPLHVVQDFLGHAGPRTTFGEGDLT
ncbi:site-specific recombinase XerD [Actinomadura luteofluorescens]|uniref:Site-specific recombinase XerD n=1 Tax=Actinomadura luteofluorescens TaxID=46163 RepID=A0A7Y9ERG2_9ACTN|nr:tyrosine-type recombinase/integrase [Actinomadura luteofluorescens]NYD51740.1 site-specific recombinase XerD [Actinomadura luteofluorescens]